MGERHPRGGPGVGAHCGSEANLAEKIDVRDLESPTYFLEMDVTHNRVVAHSEKHSRKLTEKSRRRTDWRMRGREASLLKQGTNSRKPLDTNRFPYSGCVGSLLVTVGQQRAKGKRKGLAVTKHEPGSHSRKPWLHALSEEGAAQ